VVRGDIHAITLPRRRGHVQHGPRYAVIVQADDLMTLSTVAMCPTSRSAPAASFHPEITLGDEPIQILCEMVGAVDTRSLGAQVGHLTATEMRAVDDALVMVLDLPG
jgi:mRNA interferase MazF